jgi:hypothetical protein
MKKFEYTVCTQKHAGPVRDLIEHLNNMGAIGWELVAANKDMWVFKREVRG